MFASGNIVPVYSVGCERGVYYYATQYIEGQTLQQVIRDLRRPENLPRGEQLFRQDAADPIHRHGGRTCVSRPPASRDHLWLTSFVICQLGPAITVFDTASPRAEPRPSAPDDIDSDLLCGVQAYLTSVRRGNRPDALSLEINLAAMRPPRPIVSLGGPAGRVVFHHRVTAVADLPLQVLQLAEGLGVGRL